MLEIDFMVYARKVQVKKLNLKTFGDFLENLIRTFSFLSNDCRRVDIVFDLYNEQSIKYYEHTRRGKSDGGIKINIRRLDQPLPTDMDKFWCSSENKASILLKHIKIKNIYTLMDHTIPMSQRV